MATNEYEVIDIHIHLFRSVEHEKVALGLPGRADSDYWGNPEAIIPFMDRNGISKIAFLNLFPTKEITEAALGKLPATLTPGERTRAEEDIRRDNADRIRRHNEWACNVGKQQTRLVPFIGIQKILGTQVMAEEVAIRSRDGARGVKLHPGMYRFFPNDRDLWPMYEVCQDLGLPVLSDSGLWEGAPPGIEYGEPLHFTDVLKDFPRLTLILAHLGSAFWDERIELAQQFSNVYFDTSQGFSIPWALSHHRGRGLSESDAVRVIRKIGIERIIFGSDGPSADWTPQYEEILSLALTEEERRLVLAENARRILKI